MEKLITETNFTTINYDSNSEFIRSDLKIVKKKDWNDRGCFTRLWHWLTNTTVDSIKVAEKIAQLAKKVQQAHPFKRGFERQLNKFAQGLSGNDSKK